MSGSNRYDRPLVSRDLLPMIERSAETTGLMALCDTYATTRTAIHQVLAADCGCSEQALLQKGVMIVTAVPGTAHFRYPAPSKALTFLTTGAGVIIHRALDRVAWAETALRSASLRWRGDRGDSPNPPPVEPGIRGAEGIPPAVVDYEARAAEPTRGYGHVWPGAWLRMCRAWQYRVQRGRS